MEQAKRKRWRTGVLLTGCLLAGGVIGGVSWMNAAQEQRTEEVRPEDIRHDVGKWAVMQPFSQPPVIDGKPGDEVWEQAARLEGFSTAFYGHDAGHGAAYRIGYDNRYVYVSGTLARSQAETLAQVELVIRPLSSNSSYYTVKLPIAEAPNPAINTVWNPVMDNINVSTDQGRVRVEPEQFRTSEAEDGGPLYLEAAVPLAAIAPEGVVEGTEWRFNLVHVNQLYTRPLDSWVTVRNTDHWHAGGASGNLFGDLIGQNRLGSLFFAALPDAGATSEKGGAAAWTPERSRLSYTGYTAKKLDISLPRSGVSQEEVRLYWREPGGSWEPLSMQTFATSRRGAEIGFEHPEMRKNGLYRLMVEVTAPASGGLTVQTQLLLDKERVIEAGERVYAAAHPKLTDRSGTRSTEESAAAASGQTLREVKLAGPSENVQRIMDLIPPQPGFTFAALPSMPELYPQGLYELSRDGQSITDTRNGQTFPNADYPEDKTLTVSNALGETVSIPYHEGANGQKFFMTAHKWYLQKARAIAQTQQHAKGDPLGAARLLDRFADAYQSYNPTVDRVGGALHASYSQNRASGPPYAYWGGVWERWWYNDLGRIAPLLAAYTDIKKTNAFEVLSQEVGYDVEQKVIERMFRPSVEFTLGYVNRFSNMSMQPWTSLITAGKALDDPDLIHRVIEYVEQFTMQMYLSDGFWQEVTPSYHVQTVDGLKRAIALLDGWSDPEGYVSPRTGVRYDKLDMAQQFPVIARAIEVANRLVYPNGNVMPVMDTWAVTFADKPQPDGSMLLPGTKIGRLAGGSGATQTHLYMGFQPKYGHTHLDALNLTLYAGGQELLPDLGYSHNTKYRSFTLSTIGHNTVVVDGKNMVNGEAARHGGNIEAFVTNGGLFQAMRAEYEGAYPGVAEYSREPWFVPFPGVEGGEQGYVLDLFRVSGGSRHEYTLQGDANRDAVFETELPLTDYGRYLLPPGTQVVEPVSNSDFGKAENHYPGYIYVRDVKQAQLSSDSYGLSLVTRMNGDERMKMHITGLLEPGVNELFLGRSPSLRSLRVLGKSKDNNDEADKFDMPKLLQRRDGDNLTSLFATVLEPYAGEKPRIASAERLVLTQAPPGAIAVSVTYGETTDILLSNPHHPEQEIVVGDVRMTGRMGLIRMTGGEVSDMTLVGGGLLEKGGTVLIGKGEAKGSVVRTMRKGDGDAYDALVTRQSVPADLKGHYVVVTHPDASTTGFLIGDIVRDGDETMIVLAEHDPGFTVRGAESEQLFYPMKRWTGEHTFRIYATDRLR